jgi:hypothetical protein
LNYVIAKIVPTSIGGNSFREERAMKSRLVVLILISLIVCLSAAAQMQGSAPNDAGPSSHWRFVRNDAVGLKELGDGDMVAGMNKLGAIGYELFIVTTANDTGAAGWLYFRQSPWNMPMERPKIEYKQVGDEDITKLGDNDYNTGLMRLEGDNWQLIAVTTTKNGGVGWSYFMRVTDPRNAANPPDNNAVRTGAPTDPVASDQPRNPLTVDTTGDFSTPKGAVQTLITAATAKNADLLSKCFADDAAEEFKALKNKTAPQKDLDDLAALFKGATVTKEDIQGSKATVSVKCATRDEEIELTRTPGGWRVVDF